MEKLDSQTAGPVRSGIRRGLIWPYPRWLVLLGAEPTGPETEYGWIEPAEPLPSVRDGSIRRVRRFWEKPPTDSARACLEGGCLWNTLVFVAKASTLLDAGQQFLPGLQQWLALIGPFVDSRAEAWAIQQAYALAPSANFSRSVLKRCPPFLAVSKLPPLTWCDWGTPKRVIESLLKIGISPPWLGTWDRLQASVALQD